MSLIKLAHHYIQSHVQIGDSVIDATLGNGHDTLFLATQVGLTGRVYGFDIQASAIDKTRVRLQQQQLQQVVTLIQASHAEMMQHVPNNEQGNIKACMFNLGYLPSGDKAIVTQTATTLQALEAACRLLAVRGIITVLAYTGHHGGLEETVSVEQWCTQLDPQQFYVQMQLSNVPSMTAPRLFVITKL